MSVTLRFTLPCESSPLVALDSTFNNIASLQARTQVALCPSNDISLSETILTVKKALLAEEPLVIVPAIITTFNALLVFRVCHATQGE